MELAQLAELRACGAESCDYKVPNGLTDVDHILKALTNHILTVHPAVQKPKGGGSVKLTATLPMLEDTISETAYQAWLYGFNRYCVSCKLLDDKIKNQVFEAVPTILADQICVDLEGTETKTKNVFEKVMYAVVKKRSVFLYRKEFHELKQLRGEDPERFAARIKQLAPACKLITDDNTP